MSILDLDKLDYKILEHLQTEGRISNLELAEKVGLSPSPCSRRVKHLEDIGVIRRYVALLDAAAVGWSVSVFVSVTLEREIGEQLNRFEDAIGGFPEVMECYLMTGDSDYLLRVVVEDVQAYERFLRNKLTLVPGVASIKSSFALKQICYETALPL